MYKTGLAYSRICNTTIGVKCLTTEFGMGSGITILL